MGKLFKKLNNQLAVVDSKTQCVSEEELKDTENKIIFENYLNNLEENLNCGK